MKLWAGRFSKEADERVNDFNSSIRFDCRMFAQDITGSMAHAQMLADQGIIAADDARKIREGLAGILEDLKSGALAFDPQAEDIHMFVEQELTRRIGDAGKRLHTARSRNDQVALDLRLYLREEIPYFRAFGDPSFPGKRAPEYHHAWLYPFTARPAHYFSPPFHGLCQYAYAGYGPLKRCRQPYGRMSLRLRRFSRGYLPH